MRIKSILLFVMALHWSATAYLQHCTTLGQTPQTAFPVCGTSTFTQNTVPLCGVTPIPTFCGGGTYQNRNPFWYRFTCYTAGTLGFLLDPMSNIDDYDWVLFDITGRNPADVFTTISLNIAENWSAAPDNTGTSSAASGLSHCAGGTPNFSAMPVLIVGHEYLLMVSNWSASQQGYTLSFGGGTAVITDPLAPAVQSAVANCDGTAIAVQLNKKMRCSSLAANGSDFIIAGATIIGATGFGCSNGFDVDSVLVSLSAPLPPGNHTITMANGGDGNTLLDLCGTPVAVGDNANFTVAVQSPLPMGIVNPPACAPNSVTLTFPDPIRCNSVAANGSDFIITGPSAVTISSATAVNCSANGETNTITLQLSAAIITSGTYQVAVATGNDGNTLVGQCSRQVAAGATTTFPLAAQPPLPMGTVIPPSCSPSSLTINFTESVNCQSIAANGTDFIITGPSGVAITGAAGSCNINPQINSIVIQLATPITTSGTYQLQMVTGSDGNTLTGDCYRGIPIGEIAPFIIPDSPPVPMDNLAPVGCSSSTLRLTFNSPVRCGSIAANGTDFNIAGPSSVGIVSATGSCDANGLTSSIDIQLSSPIVIGGTYQLQLAAGSDGNTLLSECNRPTPLSSLSFTASDTVSAEFQYQIQYDCEKDTIVFSHNGQHNVTNWEWTINGTQASTAQTFTQIFSASSQHTVQLAVSNGVCTDTYSENIILDNKVVAAFAAPDFICPEDTANFIDNSTGDIDNWQWNFGNNNTSSLQNPPGQSYPTTGIETLYNVSLTVSTNEGCRTVATKTLKVLGNCLIAVPTAFTPNNDGLNDFLYPLNAIKAENLDFKVFNRWGQFIFQSREWTKKWDGRFNGIMQATNVYVWTLRYTHRDTRVEYSLKGTATLIR